MDSLSSIATFSRKRQNPLIKLQKVRQDSESDVTVVIPTKDSRSSLCEYMKNFLAPAKIIFVESQGQFFNYSKALNVGIREALKDRPEWLIISNDDMIPETFFSSLLAKLKATDSEFLVPYKGTRSAYPTEYFSVVRKNFPYNLNAELQYLIRRSLRLLYYYPLLIMNRDDLRGIVVNEKYSLLAAKFCDKIERTLLNFNSFGIFKSEIFNKFKFDETFINGEEDYDLVLSLADKGIIPKLVDFSISDIGAFSLNSPNRFMQTFFGKLYLNYKRHYNEL